MKYIIKLNITIVFFLFVLIQTSYSKSLKILILGDSLIAGYGLLKDDGFVNQLQKKLNENSLEVKLVNGGVSGETSTGLYNRFKWVLEENFDGVVISIGANDALRGIEPQVTYKNIENILKFLNKSKIPTMLFGWSYYFVNFGCWYIQRCKRIFNKKNKKHCYIKVLRCKKYSSI